MLYVAFVYEVRFDGYGKADYCTGGETKTINKQKHGAVPKVWGSPNYFKFTSEFKSAKI